MMQSSNPALQVATSAAGSFNFGGTEVGATLSGTTNKSLMLIAVTMVFGWFTMKYTMSQVYSGQVPSLLMTGSIIAAFVIALIACFKPTTAPITAPLYAVAEGVGLGALSGVFEVQYPGIVSTAVMATFVVVVAMLALWKFRLIQVTSKFRAVVTGATLGVVVLYVVDMLFHLFGSSLLPQTGALSIGISLLVCTIAAFNLILDFDQIEQSVNEGLPKYFEYFNAFSLLVTICWLYIEILRLLAKRE
ncbi:MAG: Bax inhibitor-1/YccA family protein [Succinivibrio sp.]|nr:Bax inhibitor-1/YccA family protein [Succinivibrio sp.]